MNSKTLTIVIPVYNVEKYIRQCLSSIIVPNEQMNELEVIVINDGSQDRSSAIAHEYSKKYPNTIIVIDKENGGHGSAWNIGLSKASGKYIRFLDSDDWLSNLSDFLYKLNDLDVDLVFTQVNHFYQNSNKSIISKVRGIEFNQTYSTDSFSFLSTGNDYRIYNFWYCTYRTELLKTEHPLFVENSFYDDAILFLVPFILGRDMIFLDSVLYNYRLGREGQSVNNITELKHAEDYVKVSKKMIDFVVKHNNVDGVIAEQRNAVLTNYMKNRCSLFSSLPYYDYKRIMKVWYPYLKEIPYIQLSPKILLYKYLHPLFAWSASQFINKYVLKI